MVAPEQRKLGSTDWDHSLARPQRECAECHVAFGEGSEYVSVLSFEEKSILRADLCPACHGKRPEQWFAFWRTRIAKADEHRKRPLDMNFLVEFFKRLQQDEQQQEEKYQQVGYIVALILVRKKMLQQVRTERTDTGEILVLRFSKDSDGTEYHVTVPTLTEERIADIKDELTRIFNIEDQAIAAK